MQAELIKSDMFNCRSPSAVLLSRIEKLKATWAHTGAPGRPVAPTVAPPAPYCCVAGATHRGARVDDNARLCRPEPESQRTWWCAAPIAATTQGTDLEWHVRPVLSVFFVGNDDVGLVGEKEKKQLIFCFSMRFSSWGWWLDCDAKCQPVSWSKK